MGKNWFLQRGIKYNIFGLIPKTSYVTQTLNIKYRGTIEPRAIAKLYNLQTLKCRISISLDTDTYMTKCTNTDKTIRKLSNIYKYVTPVFLVVVFFDLMSLLSTNKVEHL